MTDVDKAPLEEDLPRPIDDNEEEDVCRVCRVEGDEEMPLIYPCKCSGSVRYVHPDCLKSWLAASQKKHCEICGYKYQFTKVYPDYIPSRIPAVVFIRQAYRWIISLQRWILRFCLAATAWLVALPALNMSSLRTLLWAADFLSPTPRVEPAASNWTIPTNGTDSAPSGNGTFSSAFKSVIQAELKSAALMIKDSWGRWEAGEEDTLVGYIFRGQLLSISLAAVVIGLILIREWMAQHTMDDRGPPADQGPIDPDKFDFKGGVAFPKGTITADTQLAGIITGNGTDMVKKAEEWWFVQIEKAYEKALRNIKRKVKRNARGRIKLSDIQLLVRGNAAVRHRIGDAKVSLAKVALVGRATLATLKEKNDHVKLVAIIEALLDDIDSVGPYEPPVLTVSALLAAEKQRKKEEHVSDGEWEDEHSNMASDTEGQAVAGPSTSKTIVNPASTSPEEVVSPAMTSSPRTPPRPCNADEQGFEKAVSYAAPEFLISDWSDVENQGKGKGKARGDVPTGQSSNISSGSDDGDADVDFAAENPYQAGPSTTPFEPPIPGSSALDDLRTLTYTSSASDVRYASDEEGDGDDDSIRAISNGNMGRPRRSRPADPSATSGPSSSSSRPAVDLEQDGEESPWVHPSGHENDSDDQFEESQEDMPNGGHVAFGGGDEIGAAFDTAAEARDVRPVDQDQLMGDLRGMLENQDYLGAVDVVRPPFGGPGPIDNETMGDLRGFLENQDYLGAVDVVRPPIVGQGPNDNQNQNQNHNHNNQGHGHGHGHNHPAEAFDEEDVDVGEMEDWNGLLEILGIVGPIQNLFQNTSFGLMVIGASMSLLVGVPIWIGRVFLSIDYLKTATYTAVLVIKGIRVIFDPLARVIRDFAKEVVLIPALSSLRAFERIVAEALGLSDTSISNTDWIPSDSTREKAMTQAGDIFASIGDITYTTFAEILSFRDEQAGKILVSHSFKARIWTMVYGYSLIISALVILALNPAGFRSRVGDAFAAEIRGHAQFAKLGSFMFAELAIFPVMIGLVIQICTVPMFLDWSVEKLYTQLREIPFGVLFTSWIVGTSFMFMFAGVLQTLRKLCRRGVLFFIRDPSERTYNPVKDILDRPTASQIRKLGISAVMYTVVVGFIFGAACWGLTKTPLSRFQLLPLRTSSFGPISTVPFDLLFFAIAVSPTISALRPSHRGRRLMSRWWLGTARAVNLGELLTDWHHSKPRKQESGLVLRIWQVLDVIAQLGLGRYNNKETFARVPASDSVVLLRAEERKGRGVFVRLDATGCPVTRDDKILLLQQDRAAKEKDRDPKQDYKMVWLPRYWRTRVHAVVLSALVLSGTSVSLGLFAPLVIGRMTLDRALGRSVHDGYNWMTGFYILWGVCSIGNRVRRSIVISQLAVRIRRSNSSIRAKRVVKNALARSYALIMLYLVLPALMGVSWELYIAMPIRYGLKSYTPVLHLWEAWAMGLVLLLTYVAMMHDADHVRGIVTPAVGRVHQLRECYRNSFSTSASDVHEATSLFAGLLVGSIIAPSLISLAPAYLYRDVSDPHTLSVIYRVGHPVALILCLLVVCRRNIMRRWSVLRQVLIDAEYVIEERAENYEPEPAKPIVAKSSAEKGPRKVKTVSFADTSTSASTSANVSGVEEDDDTEIEEGDRSWEDVDE